MKDSAETSAFESFTAIDNDACSVAIRSIDPNSSWGYEIQVALENKSPDKTYMFAMETATVNGVETEICNLSWSGTTLEENGITEVTDLEFTLRAYDEDDWSGNDLVHEEIAFQPQRKHVKAAYWSSTIKMRTSGSALHVSDWRTMRSWESSISGMRSGCPISFSI